MDSNPTPLFSNQFNLLSSPGATIIVQCNVHNYHKQTLSVQINYRTKNMVMFKGYHENFNKQ